MRRNVIWISTFANASFLCIWRIYWNSQQVSKSSIHFLISLKSVICCYGQSAEQGYSKTSLPFRSQKTATQLIKRAIYMFVLYYHSIFSVEDDLCQGPSFCTTSQMFNTTLNHMLTTAYKKWSNCWRMAISSPVWI